MSVTVPCDLVRWASGGESSLCSVGFDCRDCPLMQDWEKQLDLDGYSVSWECADCVAVKESVRFLAGYYTECDCQKCRRPTIMGQMVIYERSHEQSNRGPQDLDRVRLLRGGD